MRITNLVTPEPEAGNQTGFFALGTYWPDERMFPYENFYKYYGRYHKVNPKMSQADFLTSYKSEYLKQAISTDLNLRHHFGIKPEMLGLIKDREASLKRVFKIMSVFGEFKSLVECWMGPEHARMIREARNVIKPRKFYKQLIPIAKAELWVREATGNNDGFRVEE
ncbi:hypothetical protein [Pedobacter foliorum]|uniref:hypothetical protein n=1 Tax=Pedobacter foliorum TaxID=2739058 RepID=UPI001FE96F83|nr:hypothetical protein [Pedobacter foliorum]